MPERIQVRDELNAIVATKRVQLAHFLRRHRRRAAPHFLVPLKRKRVLCVELEAVVAQAAQQFHERKELRHCRHPAARDVEHEPALGEIRIIAQREAWQPRLRRLLKNLRKCLRSKALCGFAEADFHAVRRVYRNGKFLVGKLGVCCDVGAKIFYSAKCSKARALTTIAVAGGLVVNSVIVGLVVSGIVVGLVVGIVVAATIPVASGLVVGIIVASGLVAGSVFFQKSAVQKKRVRPWKNLG